MKKIMLSLSPWKREEICLQHSDVFAVDLKRYRSNPQNSMADKRVSPLTPTDTIFFSWNLAENVDIKRGSYLRVVPLEI